MSAREAKNALGLRIDSARAGPVLIEKRGRCVVVVFEVEECERLNDSAKADSMQSDRALPVRRSGEAME
jgi:antitoxin (DNA-binding transcriptional repressor) of toxin-antitoxin stability system